MQNTNLSFDELTSAYTKAAFNNLVGKFLFKNPLQGILLLDIDNFKYINRSRSQETGDAALTMMVGNLYKHLPKSAIIGRTGGDEFSIFLSKVQSCDELKQTARQLVDLQRKPLVYQDEEIQMTVSVGAVLVDQGFQGTTLYDVLNCAEIAMSKAKENGKSQYVLFQKDQLDQYHRETAVLQQLQKMVRTRELNLEFQPLFNIQTGKLVGFEVLSRMVHELYGQIPPVEFIRIAENNNLICDIDRMVLEQSCEMLHYMRGHDAENISLSVNVSPIYFMNPDFFREVLFLVNKYEVNTSCLAIELTEESFINSFEHAREVIADLSRLGIKMYLDDFGVGYSNLIAVQELPIECLKIDKSLVDQVQKEIENVLVKKTIEIANLFHVDVIAEGIETELQLQRLREMNCGIGQGFYLGRPMQKDKVMEFISQHQ